MPLVRRVRAHLAAFAAIAFASTATAQSSASRPPGVAPSCAETTLADLQPQLEAAERRNSARRDRSLTGDAESAELGPHLGVLADCLLRRRDPGFDRARSAGYAELSARVVRVFNRRSDARLLLAVGLAYLADLTESIVGDVDVYSEVPFATALLRRSVELAPDLDGARALVALGALECARSSVIGGQPQAGLAQLERAAQLSARANLSVQLAIAESCAVALNDRDLFDRMLHEILSDARSGGPYARENALAKRRAAHLLDHAGVLFP
jgi:hypothetical protein